MPIHVVPAKYETISGRLRVWQEATGSWIEFVIDPSGVSASGIWRTAEGAPSDDLGANGDLYLNELNGDVYQRVSDHYVFSTNIKGPQGLQGAPGVDGTNGATWRDGIGVPSDIVGVNGDYYLDHTTGDVYKKAAGFYGVIGSILGPQGPQGDVGPTGATGADGKTWRSAAGAPSDAVGVDGDFYLDRSTGDVYQKSSGTYSVVANIEGPQGDVGPAGADGAEGPQGPQGIQGIQGDPGPAGADGADGAPGADGADGAPGSVWRDGSGAPSNALGIDGDYYLDDDTGDVYLKTAGVYAVVATLGAGGGGGAAAPTYSDEVLADTPVAYVRFEEAAGASTFADLGSAGLTWTKHGAVTSGVSSATDELGNCVQFGGAATDYLSAPDAAAMQITGDVTIEAWINISSLAANRQIYAKGSNGYTCYVVTTGALAFAKAGVVNVLISAAGVITAGTDHHVVFTRAGNVWTIYVDGAQVAQTTSAQTITGNAGTDAVLGITNQGGTFQNPFVGKMDEAAIYNYALSAARVADHYAARVALVESNPSARATAPGTQTLAASAWTAISLTSETFDTDGFHDNVTNTNRLTVPSGFGGRYMVSGQVSFDSNGTGERALFISKNGVPGSGAEVARRSAASLNKAGSATAIGASEVIDLADGDWVGLYAWSDTASLGVLADTHFSLVRV